MTKHIIDKKDYFNKVVEVCSSHVDIVRLYELLTGKGTRYGGSRQENVSCPWHGYRGDFRPSATIYSDTNMFFCHVCHKRPLNVVDFVQNFHGLSFKESVEWLEINFGFQAFDDKDIVFSEDIINSFDQPVNLTSNEFQEQLEYFEENLRHQKEYFGFETYCKLFYAYDSIRRRYFRNQFDLKEAKRKFDRLKTKTSLVFEKGFKNGKKEGSD